MEPRGHQRFERRSAPNAYREYVTWRTVQHTVGGRAQNQRNAVAAMAADDYQICFDQLGNGIDLGFRSPENQMLIFLGDS